MTDHPCKTLVDLALKYESLQDWTDEYRRHLQQAIGDLSLIVDEGWTIHFAVDFHEIHDYLFPLRHFIQSYASVKREKNYRRRLAIDHLTRAYVFGGAYDNIRLHLLPPYVLELSEQVLGYVETIEDKESLEGFAALMEEELRALDDPLGKLQAEANGRSVSAGTFKTAFTRVRQQYADVLAFVASVGANASELLETLVEQRLEFPDPRNAFGRLRRDEGNVTYWNKLLAARIDKGLPNERDAIALDMVERASKDGLKTKDLYLLISNADLIGQVVADAGDEKTLQLPSGYTTTIVRDLGYFRLCMLHSSHERSLSLLSDATDLRRSQHVLDSLRDEIPTLEEYAELNRVNTAALDACPRTETQADGKHRVLEGGDDNNLAEITRRDECRLCRLIALRPKLENSIRRLNQIRHQHENGLAVISSKPYIDRFAAALVKSDRPLENQILTLFETDDFKQRSEHLVSPLKTQLMIRLLGFNARIVAFTQPLKPDDIGFLQRFPFGISLARADLQERLDHLKEQIGSASEPEGLRETEIGLADLMAQLLDATKARADQELVEALVLLTVGDFRLCEWMSRLCKERHSGERKEHFAYLETISAYRQDDESALPLAEKAVDETGDPRQHLLASYLRWRKAQQASSEENAARDHETAIRLATEGFARPSASAEMRANLANNAAYFLAQLGERRLEEAKEWLSNLRDAEPDESVWRPNWLHTAGFVSLQEAQTEEGSALRDSLLETAEEYFSKVVSVALEDRTRSIAQEHLELTRRLAGS